MGQLLRGRFPGVVDNTLEDAMVALPLLATETVTAWFYSRILKNGFAPTTRHRELTSCQAAKIRVIL